MSIQTSDLDQLKANAVLLEGDPLQAWSAMLDALSSGDGSGLTGVIADQTAMDFATFFAPSGYSVSGASSVFMQTDADASSLIVGGNPLSGLFDGSGALAVNTFSASGGTFTSDVAGNVVATTFTGDGTGLTDVPAANTPSDFATFFAEQGYSLNGSELDFITGDGDITDTECSGQAMTGLFDGTGGNVALAQSANSASGAEFATLGSNSGNIIVVLSATTSGFIQGDDGTELDFQLSPVVTNAAPTTGTTVQATGYYCDELIYIQPAGTLLALTVELEPGGGTFSDIGDRKTIFISQVITGLTVSATGGTVRGTALTTSGAVNGSYEYIKVTSTDWLRIR